MTHIIDLLRCNPDKVLWMGNKPRNNVIELKPVPDETKPGEMYALLGNGCTEFGIIPFTLAGMKGELFYDANYLARAEQEQLPIERNELAFCEFGHEWYGNIVLKRSTISDTVYI